MQLALGGNPWIFAFGKGPGPKNVGLEWPNGEKLVVTYGTFKRKYKSIVGTRPHTPTERNTMSETASERVEEPKKVYPGNLAAYTGLRAARENYVAGFGDQTEGSPDTQTVALLAIAEELAGLSYILDGIRFNSRKS